MKVLVIDDSVFSRNMLKTDIEEKSHVVTVAKDGKEGLKKIKDDRPDLIFLDIVMPDLDGFDVLEEINKMKFEKGKKPIKVVACTALSKSDVMERLKKADVFKILHKPIKNEDLVDVLYEVSQAV